MRPRRLKLEVTTIGNRLKDAASGGRLTLAFFHSDSVLTLLPRLPLSPSSPLGPSGPMGPLSPFSPLNPSGPVTQQRHTMYTTHPTLVLWCQSTAPQPVRLRSKDSPPAQQRCVGLPTCQAFAGVAGTAGCSASAVLEEYLLKCLSCLCIFKFNFNHKVSSICLHRSQSV